MQAGSEKTHKCRCYCFLNFQLGIPSQTFIHKYMCILYICNCDDVLLCLLLSVWICCYYYHYRYYYLGYDIACVSLLLKMYIREGKCQILSLLNILYYLHTLMHLNYIISKEEKGFFLLLKWNRSTCTHVLPLSCKVIFTFLLLTAITHITNMGNGKWV